MVDRLNDNDRPSASLVGPPPPSHLFHSEFKRSSVSSVLAISYFNFKGEDGKTS